MEGILEKKSDILTMWRSRYFRFDEEEKVLMWFPTKDSASSKGMVTITKVFRVPDRPSKRMNRIDILSEKVGKKYWVQVAAPNKRVMEKWLKSLSVAATVTDDISSHPRCEVFTQQMEGARKLEDQASPSRQKKEDCPEGSGPEDLSAKQEEDQDDSASEEGGEERDEEAGEEGSEEGGEGDDEDEAASQAASSAAFAAVHAREAALVVKQRLKRIRKTIKKLQQKLVAKKPVAKKAARPSHARTKSKYGDINIDPRGMITVVLNKTTGLGLVLADNDFPDALPPRFETAVAGFAPVGGKAGPAEISGTVKPGHILAKVNSMWVVGKPHSEVLQIIHQSDAQIELAFSKDHKHARHVSSGAPLLGCDDDGPRCVVLTTTTKHERRMEANERKLLHLLSAKMVLYTVEYVDIDGATDTSLPDREIANLPQVQIFGIDNQVNLYTYDQVQELEDNDQLDDILEEIPQVDDLLSYPALS
jgi:hypothetical protein